jgi:hypothetical protein
VILHNGSFNDRYDAAASLISLVLDNKHNGKLIIEQGGVGPLLKLIKEIKKEVLLELLVFYLRALRL